MTRSSNLSDANSRAVAWPISTINGWIRARVVEAGGDPADVPAEPFRLLRLPEVKSRTGLSTASLYRRISAGQFPKPISLSGSTSLHQAA